ncbi:hypothetical protein RGQ15_03490 [Paracoccus sp. MBLB3053]|uniref:Uncharacterized protein n=1 Tax=Paracoccus aurantius TaxID=3073814 RepID=A0ABU2HNN6_9RHOB|nr:hypothetical protein [Paracoccus sp. MBLB3053]MDS9466643.1 hypothetical protein [Paracoccus sp. MBLB3053]
MTRHIADKTHETGSGRVRNYTRQERESAQHPSIRALHSRPKKTAGKEDAASGRRVAEYARIERGHTV